MNVKMRYVLLGLVILIGIIVVVAQSQMHYLNNIPIENITSVDSSKKVIVDHFDFMPQNWPPEFQIKRGMSISLYGTLVVHNESTFVIYIMKDDGSDFVGINASWYMVSRETAEKLGLRPPSVPDWLEVKINLGKPVNWILKDEVLTVKNANLAYLKPGKYNLRVDLRVGENAPKGSYNLALIIASPHPVKDGGWFVSINRISISIP